MYQRNTHHPRHQTSYRKKENLYEVSLQDGKKGWLPKEGLEEI